MSTWGLKHEDRWNFNGFKTEHGEDEFRNVRKMSPILHGTYLYKKLSNVYLKLYMLYFYFAKSSYPPYIFKQQFIT